MPPRIANFSFDGPKQPGELAQVACLVTHGDLPLSSFSWTFQGRDSLHKQKGVEVSRFGPTTSILTIPQVDVTHSGSYSCIVSNGAGNATHSAELIILGKTTIRLHRACERCDINFLIVVLLFLT